MDFASALANLEKSAQEASRGGDGDRRRRRPDSHYDHQRRNQRPRNDQDRRNPLDGLYRFGYRVAPYRPVPPPDDVARPKHIALLAITIDELPYEHIWKAWASKDETIHVSLLCHAKFPDKVKSSWLKQRLLTRPPRLGRGKSFDDPIYHSHAPEWGSVQITRAMIDLLAAGMQIGQTAQSSSDDGRPDRESDPRFSSRRFWIGNGDESSLPEAVPVVDKFIFISETCLPVTSLQDCVKALFQVPESSTTAAQQPDAPASTTTPNPYELSWVNARNRNTPGTPKNKYERDQFTDIHRMIPQQCRWKADQWLVLSRPHAHAVLGIDHHMRSHDQLWNSFAKINASDEMYFPTALGILNILTTNDNCQQICRRPVTYTDWSEGMRNPASYSQGIVDFERIARLARAKGCLFARKFVPAIEIPGKETVVTGQINVDEWKAALQELSQEKVAVES